MARAASYLKQWGLLPVHTFRIIRWNGDFKAGMTRAAFHGAFVLLGKDLFSLISMSDFRHLLRHRFPFPLV